MPFWQQNVLQLSNYWANVKMNPIFVFPVKQCIQLMFPFEKFKNRRKSTYYSSENFSIFTKSWSLLKYNCPYQNLMEITKMWTILINNQHLRKKLAFFCFFSTKKYATSHQLRSIRQKDPKDCYQCFPFVKVLFFYQQSQPGSLVSVSFPRGHHDRPGRGLSPGGIWGWRVRWAWLILQALWLYCLTIKRSDLLERFFDTSRMCKDSVWPSQLPTMVSDLRSGFPVPYGRKTVGFFPHRGQH
jgi:hypothetical protein